ncbi:MAG: hypothetical protein H6510_02835 [Acidobacteria bacterium]|nr:hypothetical protein [Acidobacteriota bacterium]
MTSFQAIPKTELHVHLEGAFDFPLALRLARQLPEHPWHDLAQSDLEKRFATADFSAFLQNFIEGYRLLNKAEDYQQLTEALLTRLERQGVVYAEVLYSPGVAFQKRGIPLAEIHRGMTAGLRQFPHIHVQWILDTVLNLGPEFMGHTLTQVLHNPPPQLGGFCVGGGDPDLVMDPFLPLFYRAQAAGLFCVAHVGEVDGPENIRTLVTETDLVRVIHAIALQRDPDLWPTLKKKGIAIDMCPTSNIRTGVVPSLKDHPLRRYFDAGLCVALSTDDPFYFQTDLRGEYDLLVDWGMEESDRWQVLLNGWSASQAPNKLEMCAELESFEPKRWA